ncbi:MAG: hypothetical protein LUQ61_01280 [Methanoregulaceae archaeon]|nr:hypothetical protein [Methanoregulaceae archaeon]
MMKNAGYVQLNRRPVLSEEGAPLELLELHVFGVRLCIRIGELRQALYHGSAAGVERIQWNWMAYVGSRAGIAQVSKSGRALNIELFNGERFTLALDSLQAVLSCREKFATVAVLPPKIVVNGSRDRRLTEYGPVQTCLGTA